MAAQLSSSHRGEWVSSSFPFSCIMGMMAKSLSGLPPHTVGYGAQIQMGRKHSGTIMDTCSPAAQLSHRNNEKKKWDQNPCLYANLEFPKVTRKAIILTSQVKSFSEVAVIVSFTLFLFRFFCFDLVCV